jgi:hypothetical protein
MHNPGYFGQNRHGIPTMHITTLINAASRYASIKQLCRFNWQICVDITGGLMQNTQQLTV